MIEFTENQKDKIDVALNLTKDDDVVVRYFGNRLFQKTISEIINENIDKELLEENQRQSIQNFMNTDLVLQVLNWDKYKPVKRYDYKFSERGIEVSNLITGEISLFNGALR